jgi:hypothetical protein
VFVSDCYPSNLHVVFTHRREKVLDEAQAGPTKYRPSITRGSMVILQKAKADVGGLLRNRGSARVHAAGGGPPESPWGSVTGSESLSGSGSGGSNPVKNRTTREGSTGEGYSLQRLR